MMDLQSFKEAYRRRKRTRTTPQITLSPSALINQQKAIARYRRVIDCVDEGLTLEETAETLNCTQRSLKSLVYRKTGTNSWPPKT